MTEVVGSDNPGKWLAKLDAILCHPRSIGRVLFGRYWNDIEQDELRPRDVRSGSIAAIDPALSSKIRQLQESGSVLSDATLPTPEEIADTKPAFIKMANDWLAYLESEEPNIQRTLQLEASQGTGVQHRTLDIRQPSPAFRKAAIMTHPRYGKPEWDPFFDEVPERCAAARWARLIAWYCIKRAESPKGRLKDLGNDYDDSHYVFLSLYTRHLWTTDSGMRHAALAVSHDEVNVYSTWEAIPMHPPAT